MGSIIATENQIVLADNSKYFYEVKPFEMTNSLGNVVAILREYIFTKSIENKEHPILKLYKTKEGNWYEINEAYSSSESKILMLLKKGIDMFENPL
jgi:hypothetical protein